MIKKSWGQFSLFELIAIREGLKQAMEAGWRTSLTRVAREEMELVECAAERLESELSEVICYREGAMR